MDPRFGLDGGKSCPIGIRSPYRPGGSQSLYRLSYPAHNVISISSIINILRDAYVLLSNVLIYSHIYVPLYTLPVTA